MIRADMARMFRSKWLKLCTLFMVLVSAGFIFMQKTAMDYTVNLDRVLFLPISMYGIAAAVLVSMGVGDDYEGGFIRNKVFAGHARRRIYASGALANMAGGLGLYVVALLFTALVAQNLFESNVTPMMFMKFAGLGLLTCSAYICIFHMTAMLIGHRAAAGVICMALAFLMLFLSLHTNSMVMQEGNVYPLWILLYDINPTGQAAQLSSMHCLNPLRFILVDAAWMLAANLIGASVFEHGDLK